MTWPPPSTPEEIEAHNLFATYRKGWRAGARHIEPDKLFTNHSNPKIVAAYERGMRDARVAETEAITKAAAEWGIDLQRAILR